MKANKKTLLTASAMILAGNVLSLVLSYLSSYIFKSNIFSEISAHFTTAAETLLPPLAASVMLLDYALCEKKYAVLLLDALYFSLAWFITVFFEYMIAHAYAGYRIGASLLLSLGWALLMSAAIYAELIVLFFIIIFTSRIFASKRGAVELAMKEHIGVGSAFDFENPVTVGIFSASAALFLYNLGMEIANTVSYVSSCAGIYTAMEIFYLVFEYLFILALLILSHFAAHLAAAKFMDIRTR